MFDKEVIVMGANKVEAQRIIEILADKIADLETKKAVLEAQKENLEQELEKLRQTDQKLPKQ